MQHYKVNADQRIALVGLTRFTGQTVEAEPGDVIGLHPDVPDEVIESYLASGQIEATDLPLTEWPKPVQVDEDAEAVMAAIEPTARKALAQQKAADKAAAAQALLDAQAAVDAETAARAAAEAAAGDQAPNAAADSAPDAAGDAPTE